MSEHDVTFRHPCFDERAHESVGRIHLPVAPRCNIRCRFCERRVCANLTMQHPGWARQLLSPAEAVERVRCLARSPAAHPFVVGVAGPGEPLANPETLETLARVHACFPSLIKCISTNGLLLQRDLPRLLDVGVTALTVTVNAVDAAVGQEICDWVRCEGVLYRGREAARVLIDRQARGIQAALEAGLTLKVNTVLIPGVNDRHVGQLARRIAALGVRLMNLIPLIPGGRMAERRAPTCDQLREARADCERWVPQFRRCEQCSADVVRLPRRAVATGDPA